MGGRDGLTRRAFYKRLKLIQEYRPGHDIKRIVLKRTEPPMMERPEDAPHPNEQEDEDDDYDE